MFDVAIVGAGELGGTLAHVLARIDVARAIRLIDDAGRIADGKALDIMQSAPLEEFATQVSGANDVTTAAQAEIVFVADRAVGGEWEGDDALMVLERIARSGAHPIVVWAAAGGRAIVERGVRELKFERERLLGSAPEALAAAVRAVVALEARRSPQDVALTVLGVPPAQIVVPWEDATIGGLAASDAFDEPARRRLIARVPPLWPPGPYALAWAAAKTARAIAGQSRQSISAFVGPDDSNGRRSRAAALPVQLDAHGIASVERPRLNNHDRVALDNAMML
jgi:malate dehydrogenase